MRRGSKPAKAKVEAKRPVARKSRENEGSRVGDLEKRLAEALEREAEAVDAADARPADILRVIASSPTDLQPVMDVMAESAARFCGATDAMIFRLDGELSGSSRARDDAPAAWRSARLSPPSVDSMLAGRAC